LLFDCKLTMQRIRLRLIVRVRGRVEALIGKATDEGAIAGTDGAGLGCLQKAARRAWPL